MKTTVYEIENGQRGWMWDTNAETPDLEHVKRGFGFLVKCNDQRYYEVEQDGVLVMTIRGDNEQC
jgi:hypothetical protein